jgi:fructoselysine-6-P-deglycase FrlB-like protein
VLEHTGLWRDLQELPDALAATLDAREGFADVSRLLGGGDVRRIVASGNGAAYYVALALWLASLEGSAGPEVLAVPSGLLAQVGFRWRPGDVLLAVSSSGEFRDLVQAFEGDLPAANAVITATPGSTLGRHAQKRAIVKVISQRAVTHTQAFCGGVATALAIWAEVTGDTALAAALGDLPGRVSQSLETTREWLEAVGAHDPSAAIVFGTGPGWAAAIEAALLLKEIAAVPAEGVETREGATSAMMALGPGQLALSLAVEADALREEAERICAGRGAMVVRTPEAGGDRRLAPVTTFAPAAALSGQIGLRRGLDVDAPDWTADYYSVARPPA